MPDFERLTDDLSVHLAKENGLAGGHNADYWRGHSKGKSLARIQVAIVFSVIIGIYSLCVIQLKILLEMAEMGRR